MSDLNSYFDDATTPIPMEPQPPRRPSLARRIAIGAACGVVGLGLVGTTAAFAASGGSSPVPTVVASASATPSDAPTPPAAPDGTTPPTPADGATPLAPGGDCAPGGAGGPLAGGPAGTPPTPPTPPTDGSAPAAPTPPTDVPQVEGS
ncbi:hypothetical protein [Herbiconiux sp. VKM Ac-2851]|uniref:hypothetical protein n=1 Tax=Herbiconiux sp. VKM Ac-2851 TaxID=2739025 RepID=UPI001566C459|nr:hypothetical protein [Herbiconiux sp. VKM Ac-2851]NQX35421.1 hypothetical protein [Herbiconiux sp. VKM Ac-2851]